MPGSSTKVFVSATTQDLGRCRDAVKGALLTGDIHPVTQEHFPPDYREIVEILRDRISQCDAVICLLGFVYGESPAEGTVRPRSYTQIEYDVARELEKPVFVFVASGSFSPALAPTSSPEQHERTRLLGRT